MKLNEQNNTNVHMYEGYTEQGASGYTTSWGVGADPDQNYGMEFSTAIQQQAEDFYNEAGQPNEEQFVKIMGESMNDGDGICFKYIGIYDFEDPPGAGGFAGYIPAMGSPGTPDGYVEGPFNSYEECSEGENTVEDPCTDFENYASTTYGIEIWEFCSKCETGTYTDEECDCCPEEQPDPEGIALPDTDKAPLKDKSKKQKELRESFISRLQKLAGIRK